MVRELKLIVESVAKNDFIIGIIFSLILVLFKRQDIGLILLLGLIVSMVNFITSAIITNKYFNQLEKSKSLLYSFSYLLRIVIIVAITIAFSNNLSNLLAFLLGFFTHYIVLVITTIKLQKGSE